MHGVFSNKDRFYELSDPWCVVSQLLLLTDGQTSIERGFSVNKQIDVNNLCQEVLIAHRIVHDHVISVGGTMRVDITKALMTSCQASRNRY